MKEWLARTLDLFAGHQHWWPRRRCQLDGDRATARSICHNPMVIDADGGSNGCCSSGSGTSTSSSAPTTAGASASRTQQKAYLPVDQQARNVSMAVWRLLINGEVGRALEPVVGARPGDQVVEDARGRLGRLGGGVRAAVEQQRPLVVLARPARSPGRRRSSGRRRRARSRPRSRSRSSTPSSTGAPDGAGDQSIAANLSAPAWPNTALTSRWSCASTLTQNEPGRLDQRPGARRLARAEQHQRRVERQRGERLAGEADRLAVGADRGDDGDAGAEVAERAAGTRRRRPSVTAVTCTARRG